MNIKIRKAIQSLPRDEQTGIVATVFEHLSQLYGCGKLTLVITFKDNTTIKVKCYVSTMQEIINKLELNIKIIIDGTENIKLEFYEKN